MQNNVVIMHLLSRKHGDQSLLCQETICLWKWHGTVLGKTMLRAMFSRLAAQEGPTGALSVNQ